MARHIAIFSTKESIEAVLSGEKRTEIRLSQDKIAPFNAVSRDDEVFLKLKGGLVYGQVEVDNVLFYDNLNGERIGRLRSEYGGESLTGDDFWEAHAQAGFATIIFLKNPRRFLAPLRMKKSDRRSWVCNLTRKEHLHDTSADIG